ncbi:MAG: type VI secretion system tube protein Hcp [Rhodobacteraceae bacterium]|nr:type VI secretion system tube protein Hcp [Paracoccaceae bacterium]
MKIDGIKGQVKTTGFEDEISLESVQWGTNRHVASFTGTAREVSAPTLSEVVCTKFLDSSSMALQKNALFGDPLPLVELHFVRDKGGGESEAYLTFKLGQVLVTSYSISHSSGSDVPMESLSLNFLTIENKQSWRADDYGGGGEDDASYDLRTKASV